MSTPAQARTNLAALRGAIARFKAARARTAAYLQQHPEAAQQVTALRDPDKEQEAVEGLVALNQMILQRNPTPQELNAGVPSDESLGFLPMILAVPAVIGGSASLYSLFNYLAEREETVQRQLGLTSSWSDVFGQLGPYIAPLLLAGGVIGGGWFLYKKVGKGGGHTRRPPKRKISGKTGRPQRRKRPPPSEEE